MSINIETRQNPVARPGMVERLTLECNGGAVLAEDVVDDGERTLDFGDGLKVDRGGAKVFELEDVVKLGWIIKPRLLSVLLMKPGG